MNQHSSSIVYFGKLPNFGDFVRYNAGGSEIYAFEKWIQEGIYYSQKIIGQDWNSAFQESPPYHFVFYPEEAGHILVGMFIPSRDKSGRRYPFVLSFKLDRRSQPDDTVHLLPLRFAPYFKDAIRCLARLPEESDLHCIVAHARELESHLTRNLSVADGEFDRYLQGTGLETFWQAVLGDPRDPRRFLILKNMSEILMPLRTDNPQRLSLGLRFPLGNDTGQIEFVLGFWICTVRHLLGNPSLQPTYFWGGDARYGGSYLFLFLRAPMSKHYSSLILPEAENDSMCKLEREGIGKLDDAPRSLEGRVRSLLEDPDASLADLIAGF
jgi:type VI secretion system protein ImpM